MSAFLLFHEDLWLKRFDFHIMIDNLHNKSININTIVNI